jgi:XTP/dITP diphosphohydrolase
VELTTSRFSRRFRAVEQGAKAQGRSLKEMTLEEMDALWDEAKKGE